MFEKKEMRILMHMCKFAWALQTCFVRVDSHMSVHTHARGPVTSYRARDNVGFHARQMNFVARK